jgi:sodium pump decarboxylase gamma subunit
LNPIMQGLSISVIGLVLTFLALGLFILIMIVLQKIFPYRPEEEEEETGAVEGEEAQPGMVLAEQSEEQAVVAAIAVAINYWRSQGRASS